MRMTAMSDIANNTIRNRTKNTITSFSKVSPRLSPLDRIVGPAPGAAEEFLGWGLRDLAPLGRLAANASARAASAVPNPEPWARPSFRWNTVL